MLDPQKLQVLLDVLGRAPAARAEQLIIQEVVDQLIALSVPAAPAPESAPPDVPLESNNGAKDHPLPRQHQPG